MCYIIDQARFRLSPNDILKFHEATDVVTKTACRINNEEPHEKL